MSFISNDIKEIFEELFLNNEFINLNYSENNTISISDNEIDSIFNVSNNNNIYKLFGWRLYNFDKKNIEKFCKDNFFYKELLMNSLDFKYNNIPNNIKSDYLKLIDNLKINTLIINNVNNFIKSKLKEKYLSVHIRTWYTFNSFEDNRSDNNRYNHFIENKQEFINNINQSDLKIIFIATDNKNEIEFILNNIKNKEIIFYEKNKELSNIQNDFSELLILSKGTSIIGTYISTFTELAWWYSRCNENIIII
jgi:hypothetical protein